MRNHCRFVMPLVLLMGLSLPVAEADDVAVEAKNVVVVEVDAVEVEDGAGNVVVRGNAGGFQVQVQAGQLRLQQVQPGQPQRAADKPQAAAAENAAIAGDPQAVLRARQQQEQAKQFEALLQPTFRAELELARSACGSLVPQARREVLAAGREIVKKLAAALAARQMNGGQRPWFDARRQLHDGLRNVLKLHATAAELSAYDTEETLREQRRAAAARVQIIAKLDHELDLTDAQRTAIEANLEQAWDADWIRELDDAGHVMNDRRLAPDYAEAAILPHLDLGQKEEWKAWRQVAGARNLLGFGQHWNSQGLMQPDPWWGP
jgi:hypothetical protein